MTVSDVAKTFSTLAGARVERAFAGVWTVRAG
jgi:hypothetical protein